MEVENENQAQPSVDLHWDQQANLSTALSKCKIPPYLRNKL